MQNIIASLETIEGLLNSVQEQIDIVDLGDTEELLARSKQLVQRKARLSESLNVKSRALLRGLLHTHFCLTRIVEEDRYGSSAVIMVKDYRILHPGSYKFAYIIGDNKRRQISLVSWARENSLFWELNRALLAKIEKFLADIAADTSQKKESEAYNQITAAVKSLKLELLGASESPG